MGQLFLQLEMLFLIMKGRYITDEAVPAAAAVVIVIL
jgi:hypothetical protein